jgi:hypothetical protein
MKLIDMKPGLKVTTVEEIDMYPQCVLPIGTTGVVTSVDSFAGRPTTVNVKLDNPVEALSDWNSEIYVFDEDEPSMSATASHFEPRP